MTWEFQATISDVVHRVIGPNGEHAWGVDHRGFDEQRTSSLCSAEVELPIGPRSLLLVPAFPGGLVLDAVRTYQGLTDPELCTLFLGIVSELRDAEAGEERLTLNAFALDAAGRPVLIPGVSAPLRSTPRRALGEMLYHAGCGRAWAECLVPVNLALAESSPALRSVVSELLADMPPDRQQTSGTGLPAALDEVAEAMRMLAHPAALPLVPADRDSDPEAALTARLRVAAGHPAVRSTPGDSTSGAPGSAKPGPCVGDGNDASEGGGRNAGMGPPHRSRGPNPAHAADGSEHPTARSNRSWTDSTASAETLRAASRRSRRRRSADGRRSRRRSRDGRGRWAPASRLRLSRSASALRERLGNRPGDLRGSASSRWLVAGAVCLTLLGGTIVWSARPGADAVSDGPSTAQGAERASGKETADGDGATPDEDDVVRVLEELCSARAEALSNGDSEALRKLTVPGSAAAAADELIDEAVFAGQEYTIEVEDITIAEAAIDRIVARAQMSSRAGHGEAEERFAARSVEFELRLHDGRWRVAQVAESGGG